MLTPKGTGVFQYFLLITFVALAQCGHATEAVTPDNERPAFLQQYISGGAVPARDHLLSAYNQNSIAPHSSPIAVNLRVAIGELISKLESELGWKDDGFSSKLQYIWDFSPAKLDAVLDSYQNLKAQHQLYLGKLNQVDKALNRNAASADLKLKFVKQKQDYLDTILPLFEVLDELYGLDDSFFSALIVSPSVYDLASILEELRPYATSQNWPILRAQSLPVRALAAVSTRPDTTNSQIPTYLATTFVPAQIDDYEPAGDVLFSDSIRQLAADLNHEPIRIFQYVRNRIKTEYYAGAMKGVEKVLDQQSGNSVDQASLLISLLRVSGIASRYVHGIVEMPLELLSGSLALQDPTDIADALRKAGLQHSVIVRGGKIVAFEVEQTWVSALIPYANYRGAVVDSSGQSWLPLMPSAKRMTVERARGVWAASGVQASEISNLYLDVVQASSPLEIFNSVLQDYLNQNGILENLNEQYSLQLIELENGDYIPNSLPLNVSAVTGESSSLGDEHRHWVTFKVYKSTLNTSDILLEKTLPLSTLDSKRITLSYIPGSIDSQNIINQFGGLGNVPPYLVDLRPQIKVDGMLQAVAAESMPMGARHLIELHVSGPSYREIVSKQLVSGSYHAMALASQGVFNRGEPETNEADSEYTAAKILSQMSLRYLSAWDQADIELAEAGDLTLIRPAPSVVFVSSSVNVETILGQPYQLNWRGVEIDAALRPTDALPRSANSISDIEWRKMSSLHGSYLEHSMLESDFGVIAISADKVLGLASSQGSTIYDISAQNIATTLPLLSHPQSVLDDISAWVAQGQTVSIAGAPISYEAWTGSGWVVQNPSTGAAGYFLSGGIAGGNSTVLPSNWPKELLEPLVQPYMGQNNSDGLSAQSIHIIPATDNQIGEVGSRSEPIQVVVLDVNGLRVANAEVTFSLADGLGLLGADVPAEEVTVVTNELGVAATVLSFPTTTNINKAYTRLNDSDKFSTQVGVVLVDATVKTESSSVSLLQPFSMYAKPGAPVSIYNALSGFGSLNLDGIEGITTGTVLFSVFDEFNNPVSNVKVTSEFASYLLANDENSILTTGLVVGPIQADACTSKFMQQLCGENTVSFLSNPYGSAVRFVPGTTNSDTPSSSLFRYNTFLTEAPATAQTQDVLAENTFSLLTVKLSVNTMDGVQNMVGVSELSIPVRYRWYWGEEFDNATFDFYVGPRELPVGESPAVLHSATLTAEDSNFKEFEFRMQASSYAGPNYLGRLIDLQRGGEVIETYNIEAGLFVRGVKIDLPAIEPIKLSLIGGVQQSQAINFSYAPTGFVPTDRIFEITENGSVFYRATVEVDPSTGTGQAMLPKGVGFDLEKHYEARIRFNSGSLKLAGPVDSESIPLEFDVPLISFVKGSVDAPAITEPEEEATLRFVDGSLKATSRIDLANQTACYGESRLQFGITRDSNVTLELFRGRTSTSSTYTITNDQYFAAGKNSISISMIDVDQGFYTYKLTATAANDSSITESSTGSAFFRNNYTNPLPLAHANLENIDLFDGHLYLARNDISLPGRGMPINLARSYSSSSALLGKIGVAWSHSYDSKIVRSGCGGVTVVGGDGGGQTFTLQDAKWVPQKGYHGTLKDTPDGYDFYSKDGTRYHYNAFPWAGKHEHYLTSISDTNGNITKLSYDPTAKGTAKLLNVESGPHKLNFTYTNVNSIDGIGPVVAWAYACIPGTACHPDDNPLNLLVSVNYIYDEFGRLIDTKYTGNVSHSDIESPLLSRSEKYTYKINDSDDYFDAEGNIRPNTYFERAAIETVTDFNGNITRYVSNVHSIYATPIVRSGETKISAYQSITKPGMPVSTTQFSYGDLTATSRSSSAATIQTVVTDPRGNNTTYTHNSYGAPTSIQRPGIAMPKTMLWDLETDVLLKESTDENGFTTVFKHDLNGNVIQDYIKGKQSTTATNYDYFISGGLHSAPFDVNLIKNRLQSKTDRNGGTTSYRYDTNGNITEILYPELNKIAANLPAAVPRGVFTESFRYDTNGDRLSSKDRNNNITLFTYDNYGNVKSTEAAVGKALYRNYFKWNAMGLRVEARDARSSNETDSRFLTVYKYDGLNNLREIEYPPTQNGINSRRYSYDQNGNKLSETDEENRTTLWRYSERNLVNLETNALGDTRVFEYDANDNLYKQNGFRANSTTTYSYDQSNRQTRAEGPEDSIVNRTFDGVGNVKTEYVSADRVTQYKYDELNRRTHTTLPNDDDANGNVTQLVYDNHGNIIQQIDAELKSTDFEYDELHRLVSRNEEMGRSQTFGYDANGNTLYQVDAKGGVTSRTYDALNRLLTESDPYQNRPASASDSTYAESVPQSYIYDKANNPVQVFSRRNIVTKTVYDARNKVTSTTQRGTVDGVEQDITTEYTYYPAGNVKTEELANGNKVEHFYDDLNRLTATRDSLGPIVSNTYDKDGNLDIVTDANSQQTNFDYDLLNRLTRQTLPDNRYQQTTYDIYGNVETQRDFKGNVTTFAYNAVNQLVLRTDPLPFGYTVESKYNKVGNKTEQIDRRGYLTKYLYDDLHRLTANQHYPETDGTGTPLTEIFTYDLNNNLETSTDRRGIVTRTYYDLNNRVSKIERDNIEIVKRRSYDPDSNLVIEVDAEDNPVAYDYDARNLILRESRPLAAITLYQYDVMGQASLITDPEFVKTNIEYDLRSRKRYERRTDVNGDETETTEYGYDPIGNLTNKIMPLGNEWVYRYDITNRLVEIESGYGSSDSAITRYTYDDNNNLERQTDGNSNTTTFLYDELNRRIQIDYPDTNIVSYDDYDQNGNLLQMTDANGLVTTYTYDFLNREVLRSFEQGVAEIAQQVESITTVYDNNNNVTDVYENYLNSSIAQRYYQWQYDKFDRVESYTDAFAKTLGYQYDNNGNRTRLTDAAGAVTHYSYDPLNRLDSVTTNSGITNYKYYRNSKFKAVLYPNSISSNYQYNNAGRLQTIVNQQNNAVVSRYDYLYDSNGNRTQQTEENGSAAETTRYLYDSLDRLATVHYSVANCETDQSILCDVTAADLNVTYSYDEAYNRITEVHRNAAESIIFDRTYTPNDRNQIETITDNINAAESVSYSYDSNGNQLSKVKDNEITEFIWDNRDNLRQVVQGGSSLGQFLYDAQGLRTEKIGDRGTERYTYDDQSVLMQYNEADQLLAKYDYGPNRLLSLNHASEGLQFYLTDALNSVVNLANQDGSIQARYQYDAWGNKRSETGDSWNRFAFTGYEEDTESGLLYAKARFYDPDTGRFLSHDPWEGEIDTPPSLHRYLYAYQNPTVYWDPSGRSAFAINPYSAIELMPEGKEKESARAYRKLEDKALLPFAAGWGTEGAKDLASAAEYIGNVLLSPYFLSHYEKAVNKTEGFVNGVATVIGNPGLIPQGLNQSRLTTEHNLENREYFKAGQSAAPILNTMTAITSAPFAVKSLLATAKNSIANLKRMPKLNIENAANSGVELSKLDVSAPDRKVSGPYLVDDVPNKTKGFSYDAFDFNVGETFTNGRFREITLKPGTELDRAFQKGVNSPKSPFVTRGSTSQRVTNTEEARSVLALEGTSDVFPDTVTKLRVEESTRALIGPIKDGNGFQIVIDPNDLPKVIEIPGARKPLPSGR